MAISDIVNRLRNIAEQMKMGVHSPEHIAVVKEAEALLSAARWIPCSERPPEDGQDILAYLTNEHEARIVPANYDHGTWYDCIFNKLIPADQITHWMPRPLPPEK